MALPSREDVQQLVEENPHVEITIPSRGTARAVPIPDEYSVDEVLRQLIAETSREEVEACLEMIDKEERDALEGDAAGE